MFELKWKLQSRWKYLEQNREIQENWTSAIIVTWPFSSDFNFACKDGRVTTATCKYYCPLFVNPTITHCCKELYLKCGRVSRSIFEKVAMHKSYSGFVWKPVFFLLFWNVATFIENHCVFVLLFTIWWSIFDQFFRLLLPLSCFLWIQSMVV